MKTLVYALVGLFVPAVAWGQGAVLQTGPVTPNSLGIWADDHIIASAPAPGDGQGLNPFEINDKRDCGISLVDASITGPYHQFCLGHDASGNALISISPQGGASPTAFKVDLNGTIYDFPASLSGIAGPATTVVGQIAFYNNTTGTLLGNDANFTFANSVLKVGDSTGSGYQPYNPAIPVAALISASGKSNGLIGQIVNTVDFSIDPFLPVGVTGYGKVPVGVRSIAYGLYGLCEIFNANGVCIGGEVTARNFNGVAASDGVPPPVSQPLTNLVANGWQVTCGTQIGNSDCSTGIFVSNETAGSDVADPSFANGIVVNGYRRFGLYVGEGYPTGNQVTAQFDNNGNSINLVLKTTGAITASNAVLTVVDNAAATQAAIFQNGDANLNSIRLATGGALFIEARNLARVATSTSAVLAGDVALTQVMVGHAGATLDLFASTLTVNGTAGVTCSGAPTAGFTTVKGIVTAC